MSWNSQKQLFLLFVLFFIILLIQYLNFTYKNTQIIKQQYQFFQINSTWISLAEQNAQHISTQIKVIEKGQTDPFISENVATPQSSRDLKPLSKGTGKRAVLFTMDSIGTCGYDLIS